jgi:transcription initiation factor TFIIIB Brf1 subunit/transcription initiation factor TFIIB
VPGNVRWATPKEQANNRRHVPVDEKRSAAATNKPWSHSKGPKTAIGKATSAANGKRRQKGRFSVRKRRRLLADATEMVMSMKALRLAALENRLGIGDAVGLGGDPGSN